MINSTKIALQLSLNAGRSKCTRNLPRNLLNSLHVSIKSRGTREKIHGFLKGNLVQKLRPFDAVVGANCRRRGGGFTWRRCSFRIDLE